MQDQLEGLVPGCQSLPNWCSSVAGKACVLANQPDAPGSALLRWLSSRDTLGPFCSNSSRSRSIITCWRSPVRAAQLNWLAVQYAAAEMLPATGPPRQQVNCLFTWFSGRCGRANWFLFRCTEGKYSPGDSKRCLELAYSFPHKVLLLPNRAASCKPVTMNTFAAN